MALPSIYLDHNATTPVDDEVLSAVLPFFGEHYGNPSSIHGAGRRARVAVDQARRSLASLIGADQGEIFFVGSGTESVNLALRGSTRSRAARPIIVTSTIEHPAVSATCRDLHGLGAEVHYADCDAGGRVDLNHVQSLLSPQTTLVSIMVANNEVGTVQPVREIAAAARALGVRVHCDAVQAVGKIPVNVDDLNVDLLSISGHKFGAPKGVGALYIRRGVEIVPLVTGGGQELGRRSGTENVTGIVGLGRAAERAAQNIAGGSIARIEALRDRLETEILQLLPDAQVNGSAMKRLPNTLNISFSGTNAAAIVRNLDLMGIAASAGSACASGQIQRSSTLLAMGLDEPLVDASVRFSLGPSNSASDVDNCVAALGEIVPRLRALPKR